MQYGNLEHCILKLIRKPDVVEEDEDRRDISYGKFHEIEFFKLMVRDVRRVPHSGFTSF